MMIGWGPYGMPIIVFPFLIYDNFNKSQLKNY